MDLSARKYHFIQELSKIEKGSIMDKLEELLKSELLSNRDTIEKYNEDLDRGVLEIEKGELYTQTEAKKIANQW